MGSAAITKAIYAKLNADSNVTGKITTYAGIASIFSGTLAPRAATLPYILITPPVGYIVRDDKNGQTKEHFRDVVCYLESDKSQLTVEQLADAVHDSLHRTSYSVDNHTLVISEVVGISQGAVEDEITSLVVSVRIVIDKT